MSTPRPALERFAPIADYSNTISRATLCRNEKQCLLSQDICLQNKNAAAPPEYTHHCPKQTKTAEAADKTEIAT